MKKHLYDIFADKWYQRGTIYFYSDPHFGDLESYKLRFPELFDLESINHQLLHQGRRLSDDCIINYDATVKALDEMQIKNINSKAGKDSTLIILGDIGDIECVKKLKARYKILIMGNHDKGASNYKRVNKPACSNCGSYDIEYCREDYEDEDGLGGGSRLVSTCKVCGEKIYHMFKDKDNHLFDEVYEGTLQISPKIILSHEPLDHPYCLNIHGHVHDRNYISKGINVCAEHINYTPISINSIVECGKLKNIEDIHRCTIDSATERKKHKKH